MDINRFCLDCGYCCRFVEKILLVDDLLRLIELGYSGFYEYRDGFYKLRKTNGKCVFLDVNNACTIYPHRPLSCRIYPFIYDENRGVFLDSKCPLAIITNIDDLHERFMLTKEFLEKLIRSYGSKIMDATRGFDQIHQE